MDPEFRQGHVELGRILKAQGDFEGAIREFLVSQRKDLLAAAYAMSGRREEALRLQAEITSKEPGNAGGWRLLASLGETDRAVAALLKQYEGRSEPLVLLSVDPDADPLRSDPRFQELLRRIHLGA